MSGNLPAKKEAVAVTQKDVEDFLFTSETKLNPQQKALFIRLAQEFNLNPFKREIYAIAYGSNFNVVTGYQTYLARAESTGNLDGWDVKLSADGSEAQITIYRKDFAKPFVWTVSRKDFDKKQGSWIKMPDFMLKKVAIGQGFRLAFPNELSGMPYLPEEIGDNEEGKEPKPAQPAATPAKPATPTPVQTAPVAPVQNIIPTNGMTIEQSWQKDDWYNQIKKWIVDKAIKGADVTASLTKRGAKKWDDLSYAKAEDMFNAMKKLATPVDITTGTDFNDTPVTVPADLK